MARRWLSQISHLPRRFCFPSQPATENFDQLPPGEVNLPLLSRRVALPAFWQFFFSRPPPGILASGIPSPPPPPACRKGPTASLFIQSGGPPSLQRPRPGRVRSTRSWRRPSTFTGVFAVIRGGKSMWAKNIANHRTKFGPMVCPLFQELGKKCAPTRSNLSDDQNESQKPSAKAVLPSHVNFNHVQICSMPIFC